MKTNIIIISIFILTLPAMLFSQVNNPNEKRISEIINTLRNEYHWPPSSEDTLFFPDMRGAYFPSEPTEEEQKWGELIKELENILREGDLSEAFLFQLLDKEGITKLYSIHIVIDRLFTLKSDTAYAALYDWFQKQPKPWPQIGVRLVMNGKYKEEIKTIVLNDESAPQYLRLFDKATDRIILDKGATKMYKSLKEEPFASYLEIGIFENYYNKNFNEDVGKYVGNVNNRDRYDKALDRFYRKCSNNALRYYERHKNELK